MVKLIPNHRRITTDLATMGRVQNERLAQRYNSAILQYSGGPQKSEFNLSSSIDLSIVQTERISLASRHD